MFVVRKHEEFTSKMLVVRENRPDLGDLLKYLIYKQDACSTEVFCLLYEKMKILQAGCL